MLTEVQRRELLGVARRAMTSRILGENGEQVGTAVTLPDASGVFVTIKRRGALRGCLGTLDPRGNLAEEVGRCAADSASQDPRFHPVQPDELPELTLEISVLGPLETIDPADEGAIIIGRHGLVVEQAGRRGLLLPQVASERRWTPEEFLVQTSMKARLPRDAWRRGATVFRFDAEVFGD